MLTNHVLRCLILAFAFSLFSSICASDEIVDRGKQLIDSGKAGEAYALLKPLEEDRAGDPNFDYVFGLSALDSGKPLEAVFALERAVDAAPDSGPARAELARAYLMLGDTDDARNEFDKVQEMDLPADVQQTIDKVFETNRNFA